MTFELPHHSKRLEYNISKHLIKSKLEEYPGTYYFGSVFPFSQFNYSDFYIMKVRESGEIEGGMDEVVEFGPDDHFSFEENLGVYESERDELKLHFSQGKSFHHIVNIFYLYFDEEGKPISPYRYTSGPIVRIRLSKQRKGYNYIWSPGGTYVDQSYLVYQDSDYVPSIQVRRNDKIENLEMVDGKLLIAIPDKDYRIDDWYLEEGFKVENGFLTVYLKPESSLPRVAKIMSQYFEEGVAKYPYRRLIEEKPDWNKIKNFRSKFNPKVKVIDDVDVDEYDKLIDWYSEEERVGKNTSILTNTQKLKEILQDQITIDPPKMRQLFSLIMGDPIYFGITLTKAVLDAHCDGGTCIDLRMGLGDRLIGALASRAYRYIGYEPEQKMEAVYEAILDDISSKVKVKYYLEPYSDKGYDAKVVFTDGTLVGKEDVMESWRYVENLGRMILYFPKNRMYTANDVFKPALGDFTRIKVMDRGYLCLWTKKPTHKR